MHPGYPPLVVPNRPKIPYLIGLCGFFGVVGVFPFNLMAWYLANRDINAPGFEQMPWHYQKRIRLARTLGLIGTLVMLFFWGPVMVFAVVMRVLTLLGLR